MHNHELNPNNPVVRAAHGHWHVIAALIMRKLNVTEVKITSEEIEKLGRDTNICLDERGSAMTGTLTVRLVGHEEAQRLAREHGGHFKPN